jgi:hypothetical protein
MPASADHPTPVAATAPLAGSLLAAYAARGEYTDCFQVRWPGPVSLPEFVEAFYGSPLFRLDRWLLAQLARSPSSRSDLHALAEGRADRFALWRVEARRFDEIMLAAGATRSWLGVSPDAQEPRHRVTLRFGSAVVGHRGRPPGRLWRATLGLHLWYSRVLLGAAARQLRHRGGPSRP